MGDAGEGLIDADARIQERMDEIEQEKKRTRQAAQRDPLRAQQIESLRLARADLERQLAGTAHEVRRQQLMSAIAQIDTRIVSLG